MSTITQTASMEKRAPLSRLITFGIPAAIVLSFSIISLFQGSSFDIHIVVSCSAVITILLTLLVSYTHKKGVACTAPAIVLVALLLRLLFVFQVPQLSDDIYRYFTDGYNTLSGVNPYAFAPAHVTTDDKNAMALIRLVNHPDLITIYPPAAQLVFAAGASTGGITGIKIFLSIMDIGTCILIIRTLRLLKRPITCAVLYAWNPLTVLETAGSGHIDTAGIFFLFLCITLITKITDSGLPGPPAASGISRKAPGTRFPIVTGALFSFSFLTKLLPLIYLPGLLLVLLKKEARTVLLSFGVTSLLLILLFFPHISNSMTTLTLYAETWEFSGFLFHWIRRLTGSGITTRFILSILFAGALAWTYRNLCMGLKQHPTRIPAHLMIKAFYTTTFFYLVLTPTLHPWYALYLVSFLPFAAGPAGISLCWSVLLGYNVLITYRATGEWAEHPYIPFCILAIPLTARMACHATQYIRTRNMDISLN